MMEMSTTSFKDNVSKALADGKLKGNTSIPAHMVLTIDKVGLRHTIDGTIELE